MTRLGIIITTLRENTRTTHVQAESTMYRTMTTYVLRILSRPRTQVQSILDKHIIEVPER